MAQAATNNNLTNEETLIRLIAERDAIVLEYKADKVKLGNGTFAEKLALYSLMQQKLERVNHAIYGITGKEYKPCR